MRGFDRVLSTLLGLALALAGLLTLVNLVLRGLNRPWWPRQLPSWANKLATASWDTTWVRITCACLIVAGLLLIGSQLRRWAPAELPVAADQGTWLVKRRSAEQRLGTAAAGVTGTQEAKAAVRLRKGRWQAVVTAQAYADRKEDIERSVREAMTALGAPEGSSARVRLTGLRRVG